MKALRAIDKAARKLADADESKNDATCRVALGIYLYQGPDEPPGST